MGKEKLIFVITHKGTESIVQLSEFDTVEILKIEIHKRFHVPPHKQTISGWYITPECDNTVLNACAKLDITNVLEMSDEGIHQINLDVEMNLGAENEDLELEAATNFVEKISNNYNVNCSIFCTCNLMDAINDSCLVPIENRKVLLLYLHRSGDTFSSKFMENLSWDTDESKYQNALLKAFQKCSDLSNIAEVINFEVSTTLCIVPINDSVTCLKANTSDKDFKTSLAKAEEFLIIQKQQERDLQELQLKTGNENDMDSFKYQQLMFDMLGDRDYDRFEFNQHDLLKKKIAFALFGKPKTETGDGYDKKDMDQVKNLFEIILKNSNRIARYKDQVEISFIYNCTEPLPSEKIKRAKKFPDYNPRTDLMPVPIFVLRKCHKSENPCRVFIDHMGRTYQTWDEYKHRNKLHKCEMILPLNGRYEVDMNGNFLERHLSPACGIDVKILQGTDHAAVAGGVISGGIFVAAAVPTITVAPVVVLGGVVGGVTVGVYTVARSCYILYDRSRHRETLSFANSEARGAYINILAGALGFVGAGANVAVTQLASRGIKIGTGVRATVDAIAVVNIGASGVAVINSGYDVVDRWFNENQAPSLLTVLQLSSSILFFGNAVYNFRTCSTIIEDTQMKTLQSYQESLRSNRHRKAFTKLMKKINRQNNSNDAARGRAEVIAAIRNIQNKDEVFAGGKIVLNGVRIDFNEFVAMHTNEVGSFLLNLPQSEPIPALSDTASTRSIVSDVSRGFSVSNIDIDSISNTTVKLLSFYTDDIKTKIINEVAELLTNMKDPIRRFLDNIFPTQSKYAYIIKVVVELFGRKAEKLEEQYKMWVTTGHDLYYNPLFSYISYKNMKLTTKIVKFFEQVVNMYCTAINLTEVVLRELLKYFYGRLAQKICDWKEDAERTSRREEHSEPTPVSKISCDVCGGHYYKPLKPKLFSQIRTIIKNL